MAKVTMQQVKELRERTQAGLNDCKGALDEAEGDMEKAVEVILKKGLAKSAKRAGAIAAEGEVATRVASDGTSAVIAEVNIQTDFAARNEDFKKFVQDVLEVASGASAGEDLGPRAFPGGGTLEEARQKLVARLGENITVRRWAKVELAGEGKIHDYVHMGGKMGALIVAKVGSGAALSKSAFGKFVEETAMQVVATAPLYIDESDVPDSAKAKQREIFAAQLKEEGKVPEERWPKVLDGKVGKWMKEVCLLDQPSVIESNKSVDAVRADASKALETEVTVSEFVRYERGEGIEKPKDDFAAEAAKMSQT